jgi:thioredoxin
MKILELNRENFVKTVSQSGIVIVDCWAPWCGVCRQFSPIYESVANQYPGHAFSSLDTQAEEELARDLGIEHIPTLMVFRDGVPVFCEPGNYTEAGLIDIINQVQSLDIELVKEHLAAIKTAHSRKDSEPAAQACR